MNILFLNNSLKFLNDLYNIPTSNSGNQYFFIGIQS